MGESKLRGRSHPIDLINKTRECNRCHKTFPLDNFGFTQTQYKGKTTRYFRTFCKSCCGKVIRKSQDIRRVKVQQYIINYLKQHPCVDCGNTDIVVLEFDHVFGPKKKGVSILVANAMPIEEIQEEIDKCEVRCANCHRRRTAINSRFYRSIYERNSIESSSA